jgi:hypothetical protein
MKKLSGCIFFNNMEIWKFQCFFLYLMNKFVLFQTLHVCPKG